MVAAMAKRQTRRSISVNRNLYDRLKAFCESANTPMSAFTEAALEARMAPATMLPPKTDAAEAR
jgi:hypothetical protein